MPEVLMLGCYDCGLPYRSAAWADFVVSDSVWKQITAVDDANLLCAGCMVLRANLLGIKAEGRFTSGPFADNNWKKPGPPQRIVVDQGNGG